MAHDPYSACVCGSGKKLKFCCQDILGELQRIEQLRDNQPDVAEQHLRTLYASHPDRDVLVLELGGLVHDSGNHDEAQELCIGFLRRHPDEVRVILLLSELILQTEGFAGARRFIHRAIQLAQSQHYNSIAMLLASVSEEVMRTGNPASAYAHVRRAIQFASDDVRSSLLMMLSGWTMRIHTCFPLLGSQELMSVNVGEARRETEQKAQRLSELGCWEPSAILYSRLIRDEPDNGALWYNLGLFYLWDDRQDQAAEALHKAGGLLNDFDMRVEAEALAVLLDLDAADDGICTQQISQRIRRPRELSSRLQEHSRFWLTTLESQLHSTEASEESLHILVDVPREDDGGQKTLGIVTISANIDGEQDYHVVSVTAEEGSLEEAWEVVRSAAGDCIEDDQQPAGPSVISSVPLFFADFCWNICYETSLPVRDRRRAVDNRIAASVESWLQRPAPQLNDLPPLQAAEDPDLKVKTAAAVVVLYCLAQRMHHEIRLGDLRQRLNVPAPALRIIDTDQAIESVPLLYYAQLSISDLTDSQLIQLASRVGLFRDVGMMEQVLDELFRRPAALEEYSPRRAHLMRALVARLRNRSDDMAESFEAARTTVQDEADQFQSRLELDLRELTFRLDDPEDPGIPHLLRSMRDQYFQKLPEVAEAVRQQLTQSGCRRLLSELDSSVIVTAGVEQPAQSSGKLWLPGQD